MSARRSPALRAGITALTLALAATVAALVGTRGGTALAPTAAATNPVTPGNFRGLGFDQCTAPSQAAMDRWMDSSPYLAVGIYISGNSRACRSQPNLTPAWVHHQLARGWKLLPITLGPQASCNSRYPRYGSKIDPRISATVSGGTYAPATSQAKAEAAKTVATASSLGIVKRSTLWYDLEAFDVKNSACRNSALTFLSVYTQQLHAAGYVSGVYSSAGSGIVALEQARAAKSAYTLPDRIWLARWDGKANTSTTYIPDSSWSSHSRVKQYLGGHTEKWGGVRINIDRDYVDLGRGAYAARQTLCGGVGMDFGTYPTLSPRANLRAAAPQIKALQCLLKQRHRYSGPINGVYNAATIAAMHKWKAANGISTADRGVFNHHHWMIMHVGHLSQTLKAGSSGFAVFHLQRALAAVFPAKVTVNGIYTAATAARVKDFQKRVRQPQTGIVTASTWAALRRK